MRFELEEFKNIYRSEFNEELTDEEAEQKARMLFGLHRALYSSPAESVRDVSLTDD